MKTLKWISEATMFLQGDLQAVFDALYTVGAIDPVLKMDWEAMTREMEKNPHIVHKACAALNACRGNQTQLVDLLTKMDSKSVQYVALEVAREFCEFQDRKDLH